MTSDQTWFLLGLPLLIGSSTAAFLGYAVRRLYLHFNWVDDPQKNHHPKVVHHYPVPRGGGLVIFGALLVGAMLITGVDKHIAGILAGALILAAVGTLDDLFDIHPYVRLLTGLAAAGCVVAAGIGIAYITNPLGGVIQLNLPQIPIYLLGKWRTIWVLSDVFALLWITWCMNMLNWTKGVDGQLPGVVVIAALAIGLLSLRFGSDPNQWQVTQLAALTGGAFLGLLFWNMYPQRLMPGYGAGSLAGYLLAVLSILSGAKLATLLLVLGVPMIDALLVIFIRLASGKSPVWGDRNHLHHILMDFGWGKRRIAGFYWLMTLILSIIALQLNPRQKAFTIVLIGLMVGGIGIWLRRFITFSKPPDRGNG